MISRTGSFSAAQLLALKDDGFQYELVEGELRKISPAGGDHGVLQGRFYGDLVIMSKTTTSDKPTRRKLDLRLRATPTLYVHPMSRFSATNL